MVAAINLPAEALRAVLDEVEKRTQQPFGVNFLIPFLEDRAVVELAASRVGVIEFSYADPDPSLVELVHRGDALACWQVGSVGEARAAVDAGCDLVVAQGVEAGGHVRGRPGLLPLLSEVLEAVDVPVVAAGGIATARSLAAILAAGADAARVGTMLIASAEAAQAGTHPAWVDALLRASGEDTELTETFSVMWPDAAAPRAALGDRGGQRARRRGDRRDRDRRDVHAGPAAVGRRAQPADDRHHRGLVPLRRTVRGRRP
jgi:nitronate monooxygenase